MAAGAIVEAIANVVAAGADPERIALLDNFCWGDTRRPESLATFETDLAGPCPFQAPALEDLLGRLRQLPDPRRGHGLYHRQRFVLGCAAVATLMGVLTKSTTAAVLVALLFGAAATALQEAASKQPATPIASTNSSSELSPPAPDHEDDDSDSWTAQFAGTILRGTASIMPGPAPALAWAESHSCPAPPRPYRDLFRRLRLGKSGLEAAAAEAIATNSPQGRTAAVAGLASAAAGGSVISSACLVLAASLLRRRDL
jgi:hypothetical protein